MYPFDRGVPTAVSTLTLRPAADEMLRCPPSVLLCLPASPGCMANNVRAIASALVLVFYDEAKKVMG